MAKYMRGISEVGLLLLLAGCASVPPLAPDVATTGMPNTELAVQRSIIDVSAAMAELRGMAVAPPTPDLALVPAELDRPVSLSWKGPLDAGVKTVADRVGYQMMVTGPQPADPLRVAVNVTNVTALVALQALGNAAGTAATVVVDPQHHLVEVDHHV
jgi:defect-in-organelle-trafficking protein DotD